MTSKPDNPKSDVPAKRAFVEYLLKEKEFDEVRVTRHPADITARKGKEIFYFEIKYTAQAATYFGAATLTEWEAALAHESNFRFVIATTDNEKWIFRQYTPEEFMSFSYIPPFKIFFSIPVGDASSKPQRVSKRADFVSVRVPISRDRMSAMAEIYKRFRSKLS
jgi:hypothetical protein